MKIMGSKVRMIRTKGGSDNDQVGDNEDQKVRTVRIKG